MTAPAAPMHLAAHVPDANGTADEGSSRRGGFAALAELARTAERGLFDFLLLGRGTRPDGAADAPEPLAVLPALAAVTDRLGLAGTLGAALGAPYDLARRVASLDHLSAGRAGWHLAVAPDDAARARAAEATAAAHGLWDSWTPEGAPRPFAHHGQHHALEGEFTVPRCPQGRPVAILAGEAGQDRESAAARADVLLVRHDTLEEGRAFYADVKSRLPRYGRAPGDLLVMPVVTVVLGATDAEARRRADRHGGARPSFAGAPATVAAALDSFVAGGAADGFVLASGGASGGLDDFVARVVPLLQARGAFRTRYTGTTLRSHLGLPEPVWKG
ncbi:LLM class flavin-dependent oxidoreductase [Streptomyces sp. NPDC001941]|uniref:LLM class flavin-dependent oxidoreductase n=1 Tax=Streptomyces sp. NPDC001941 TaxID=3154659 RepID=UPI0033318165